MLGRWLSRWVISSSFFFALGLPWLRPCYGGGLAYGAIAGILAFANVQDTLDKSLVQAQSFMPFAWQAIVAVRKNCQGRIEFACGGEAVCECNNFPFCFTSHGESSRGSAVVCPISQFRDFYLPYESKKMPDIKIMNNEDDAKKKQLKSRNAIRKSRLRTRLPAA